jgi:uncharacterized membrane protein
LQNRHCTQCPASGFERNGLLTTVAPEAQNRGSLFKYNDSMAKEIKGTYVPALAVGIGLVAGLRALTAPAVLAWAVKRRWLRLGSLSFVTVISGTASKKITKLAVGELIADKAPFTASRLNAVPLASRVVSGAICGATIYGVVKRPLSEGAVLGGLGAIAGAFAGYHTRKRLNRDMPDLAVAVLEDAFAIGGGVLLAALTGPAASQTTSL